MENPVLEMETTGIMSAAAEKSIPVLSLRAISDGPRAPIPFDLETMMDKNEKPAHRSDHPDHPGPPAHSSSTLADGP